MTQTDDPAVFSDVRQWVGDPQEETGGHWRQLTWEELVADLRADNLRLQRFAVMVADLDRNPNGRHEGDADVGDPSGVSQGNPRLHTGDTLGFDIGGRPYVMPPRGQRHDPAAWGAR